MGKIMRAQQRKYAHPVPSIQPSQPQMHWGPKNIG
uniref:Uncharacterized protein n=1 Tax=Setaria italica TaxID=4555 RepID=K4A435_SETIT